MHTFIHANITTPRPDFSTPNSRYTRYTQTHVSTQNIFQVNLYGFKVCVCGKCLNKSRKCDILTCAECMYACCVHIHIWTLYLQGMRKFKDIFLVQIRYTQSIFYGIHSIFKDKTIESKFFSMSAVWWHTTMEVKMEM